MTRTKISASWEDTTAKKWELVVTLAYVIKVEARGVILGSQLAKRKHFKFGLSECHIDDDVKLPLIVDVA
ncbi:hypothetical protein Tco_0938615 [Tanacetum coccineum]|uniref:Uncharacterized protein n=1 Tax=Tanacetum coccineum TaxID=301880 RepID=A0ABQ5DHM6_9ASTR